MWKLSIARLNNEACKDSAHAAAYIARMTRIYYSSDFVTSDYEFDTTRKAKWIADSLGASPIAGIDLSEPTSLKEEHPSADHRASSSLTASPWLTTLPRRHRHPLTLLPARFASFPLRPRHHHYGLQILRGELGVEHREILSRPGVECSGDVRQFVPDRIRSIQLHL